MMCGIFGIVSDAGVDPETLWFGTHRVEHRGPDDRGFVSFAPMADSHLSSYAWRFWEQRRSAQNCKIGLGSRRLSILDRSEAGHQPMSLSDSSLWIVFNGAIYNYLELRAELRFDHDFKTSTDTEALLAAYRKWGPECLNRLNGMFAFAIFDADQKKLFMARDRFGEKPFYYMHAKRKFVLASELKQFFEDESFQREIDRSALADFLLLYLQDHDERTFFKQIKQLPPAHWMQLDVVTHEMVGPMRYWQPEIVDDFDDSCDQSFEEKFVALLANSVRLRLRSDVPVGICLSGGLDSTTICTLASAEREPSLSAYTIGFPGFVEDELGIARRLANNVGVRPVEGSLDPNQIFEQLADFTYVQDGPVGGASVLASHKLYELARADGTVVLLNGQGSDELFAGYSKFFFFWWQILCSKGKWLRLLSSLLNYAAKNNLSNWSFENARRYAPRVLRENFSGIWNFALPEFRRSVSFAVETGHNGSLNQRLWKDLSQFSLPCLLHWEDRNSMSAGVEARLPFLDHRLVEAVLSTSVRTKLRNGFTKYSLRKAMTNLPSEIRWQTKKRGFETPAQEWFVSDLAGPVQDIFATTKSPLAEFFNVKAIGEHLKAVEGSPDHKLTANDLFKLAATSVWLEQVRHDSCKPENALALQ